jgi:hypothetical protein
MEGSMVKVWPVALVAATLVLGAASSAQAVVVFCPGTGTATDREFSLDTVVAATCLTSGTGNLNGSGDAINALGYTTLDKSDDGTTGSLEGALVITGSGGLSGTFTISPAAAAFGPLVIAFKSGEGQLDPDWAAFLLPAGVLSGSWSISGQQALSHANLYGGDEPPPTQTPEPMSAVLLGSGLLVTRLLKRA